MKEELEDYDSPPKRALKGAQRIPDFWLTVLKNSDDVNFMISEPDEQVLTYLRDIRSSYISPDGPDPSFRLTFTYAQMFENRSTTHLRR